FPQQWWVMPSFNPAVSETRNIAKFDPTFNALPNSGFSHTLNVLSIAPTVTQNVIGVFDSFTFNGIRLNPTMTLGSNLSFAAIAGDGTYTSTAAPSLGTWNLFRAKPLLISTTSTVSPYTATTYD